MSDEGPGARAAGEGSRSRRRLLLELLFGAAAGAALALRLARHAGGAGPTPSAYGFRPAVYAAIATWLAFSLYWSWAARNASPAARAEGRGSRFAHLVVLSTGQALVLLPVPGLRSRLAPDAWPIVGLGLALNAGALALAVWARRTLGRHWSGEITVKVDHELVTAGPYAVIRHPIYTAMLALCVGTTLVWGELHGLLGTALVVIAYARKIRLEERALAGRFGGEWDAYRARTKALIPGVL